MPQAQAALEQRVRRKSLTAVEAMETYALLTSVLLHQRKLFAAANAAEQALQLALRHGTPNQLADAQFQCGLVLTELGDAPAAIPHIESFLAGAETPDQGDMRTAEAWLALGKNRVIRREYSAAARAFCQSAQLAQALGKPHLAARATRRASWCYLHLHRPEEAHPHLEWLQGYTRQHPDDAYIRNAVLVDWARYYRVTGDLVRSSRYCQQLFAQSPSIEDEHRSEATCIAGANALDLGRHQEARLFANLALEYAVRAKWPFAMNQATALLNRIRAAESKP